METTVKLPATLKSFLIEQFLQGSGIAGGAEPDCVTIDFDAVSFADPAGMVALLELLRYLSMNDIRAHVECSQDKDVFSYMDRMGFWKEAGRMDLHDVPAPQKRSRRGSDVLLEITGIREQQDVHRILENVKRQAEQILQKHLHYGEHESSRFLTSVSEVCQNILEHSGDWGYVAVQKYSYSETLGKNVVKMVVSDLGRGIRRTLGEQMKEEFEGEWTDRVAIEQAMFEEQSRFDDPGRGHGLASVRTSADRWNGLLSIRSGTARVSMIPEWMDAAEVMEDLPFFPGTQVVLMLPEKEREQKPTQKSLFG
jgi:anti-sigma regulatory factor (Ser/Thr protein kinase)